MKKIILLVISVFVWTNCTKENCEETLYTLCEYPISYCDTDGDGELEQEELDNFDHESAKQTTTFYLPACDCKGHRADHDSAHARLVSDYRSMGLLNEAQFHETYPSTLYCH